ncbi:MAG: trehalase-like domain-containing protein, partial [Catalinimonas sp.]
MQYHPIENYGVIGDLNTVALVGIHGSIDFMCFPDFDSPSVFAALLDAEKGGYFCIQPQNLDDVHNKQLYLPDTNVLLTRFLSSEGVGELTDFMPVEERYQGGNVLVRRVRSVRGQLHFTMTCAPRFDYARAEHQVREEGGAMLFVTEKTTLRLSATVPLHVRKDGAGHDDVTTNFVLEEGETADFILELVSPEVEPDRDVVDFVGHHLYATMHYWRDWIGRSRYQGRWREMVNRSALALKLMTSYKYGSVVAAPTFGLPEGIGGERNWDYRYTWIRDASFSVYSMVSLGYTREAGDFMRWVERRCEDMGEDDGDPTNGYLGLMYQLSGERRLHETTLDHLEGYCGSRPVRIGNGAHDQLQL